MRVYRNSIQEINERKSFPVSYSNLHWYNIDDVVTILQPSIDIAHTPCVIKTGDWDNYVINIDYTDDQSITHRTVIAGQKYYKLNGFWPDNSTPKYEEINESAAKSILPISVFDIMEAEYIGEDMGQRKVVATIKHPTPIDFQIGDYIDIQLQSLQRGNDKSGGVVTERFYLYNEPQCKKTARSMSTGDAFEHTVTFYPRQYELSRIQMRDFIQSKGDGTPLIYTGFDEVTFYGGAHELLERCMACLAQQYVDNDGKPLWKYDLADSVNEDKNNALERYAFTFSQQSVMDALLKLNDKEGINTTFFINDRTIYVGYKRPYLCRVNDSGEIVPSDPLRLMYGKTSHKPLSHPTGGLYDITKSVTDDLPITKLYAYGASRNLNRYYCSDRIQSGRFVNKLMLPSFSDDGSTDYILSEDGIKKYGVIEGSKTFDEIYPSLRYMTYADIRGIKYCIQVKTSGLDGDEFNDGIMDHYNSRSQYPIARVQCYKVTPCTGQLDPNTGKIDGEIGVNKLVECAPPDDLAVYIHATGKVVKVVLMSDDGLPSTRQGVPRSVDRQLTHDYGYVPTHTYLGNDYIIGSCFCVHDDGWPDMDGTTPVTTRLAWFSAEPRRIGETDSIYPENRQQQECELHRIEYVDTFWLTDLYVFKSYTQTSFLRDGYSAWAWPRLNSDSNYPDSMLVNEVVAVEPIVIADTSENADGGRQQHWDIYLRDIGFALDQQNDFGEMVFVFDTPVVSVLDGILSGREFTIDGGENLNDYQDRVVCAYNQDGSFNDEFLYPGDSSDESVPSNALMAGAIWRLRLNRNDADEYLSSIGLVIPNTDICMHAGDHIILLDIYMPDIYVRAAENRLYREAKKFLEQNDKGNVKYSVSFDKVRFNQIPNYALQMREGVMLRMVDEDLRITSENIVRALVDYGAGNAYQVQLFSTTKEQEITGEDGVPPTSSEYIYWKEEQGGEYGSTALKRDAYKFAIDPNDPTKGTATFIVPKLNGESAFVGASYDIGQGSVVAIENFTCYDYAGKYHVSFSISVAENLAIEEARRIRIVVFEKLARTLYVNHIFDESTYTPATCDDFIDFQANKYYDVEMIVDNKFWDNDSGIWRDGIKHNDIILTPAKGDLQTFYIPLGATIETEAIDDNTTRVKYSFFLQNEFNDAHGYYISLLYHGEEVEQGETGAEYGTIRMVSVTEKDLDEHGDKVNYVDFIASSVNIKIEDNTRPDDTRIMQSYPEPIREISAQITEQTKASAWGTLMNNVHDNAIEIDKTQRVYETLVQQARNNYQNLLNLKNNIFDPDGTCNSVFLQVMMLQVGADSMNYQLRKTITSPTGIPSNYDVVKENGSWFFRVFEDDYLSHFVYTQGADNGGEWFVPGRFVKELSPITVDTETIYPTYYVCLRCRKDVQNFETDVVWMCTTDQYAVNQDVVPSTGSTTNENGELLTNFWYFNWGILIPDEAGNYRLTETRGNAYMYGDNIVCGKISTIAGNSYFDLTHGNFVLSQYGPDEETGKYSEGMTYIDGVLTIYGVKDKDGNDILERLRLVEQQEIGGENLLYVTHNSESLYITTDVTTRNQELTYFSEENNVTTHTYLPAGTYVFSSRKIIDGITDSSYTATFILMAINSNGQIKKQIVLDRTKDIKNLPVELTEACYINLRISILRQSGASDKTCSAEINDMQLQLGTKSTTFHEYVQHLTDALQGSTEIAGGLVMSNLLLLKDEQGDVKAGMSGLTDNNPEGEYGDGDFSEGVAMFAGGNYEEALTQAKGLYSQLAKLIPVLITKTGIHSTIGPFEIINYNAVAVNSPNGAKIVIDADKGISMYDSNGDVRLEIIPEELDLSNITAFRAHISLRDEAAATYLSTSPDDSNPMYQILGTVDKQITTAGTYKIYGNAYRTVVRPYYNKRVWDPGKHRGGGRYVNERTPIVGAITFNYQFILSNRNTSDIVTLTNESTIVISNGVSDLIVLPNEVTDILSAGIWDLYIRFWSPTSFAEVPTHYYEFANYALEPEVVLQDNQDYVGKTVIGTDGLLVASGNSTFFLAKTEKDAGRMDIRIMGMLEPGTQGWTRQTGQLYNDGGIVKVVEV